MQRPEGRPNPIIPITPPNHTLMMGIKMCRPPIFTHSSARCSRVCLNKWSSCWEGRARRSALSARSSTAAWACLGLHSVKGCSRAPFLVCGTLLNRTCAKRPKVDPKLLHDKHLNPLKLTPLLPQCLRLPHKRTRRARMFEIGVVFKKGMWF